ncbi:2'-5' RNA ligase family protein [Streptosporangium sp. NPDC000563]|uniref:2'-5' RNA ligase family protein n=1 Tax=Streptosporangium sp. NPDC000563 TaxID=3154366 RepID=UPI00331CE361
MTVATLEHKALAPLAPVWSITADDDDGTFTALVAVTGVEDNVKDIIVPGAVKRSLIERTPKGIHSHDDKQWTARTILAEEWLPGDPRLPDKTRDGRPWPRGAGAVAVKGQFNLDTPEGLKAYHNVRFFKEQCEWSIGYAVVPGKSKRDRKGVRHIYELALYEYSTVLVAANPLAMTLSVKSQFGDDASVELSVPEGMTPQDIADAVAQVLERKDGGADRNRGNAEDLRHWFVRGEGAARIVWGTPGDFDRCVAIASKHMTSEQAKGYCNLRHHEATGTYPGQGHKADPYTVQVHIPEDVSAEEIARTIRRVSGLSEAKADPAPVQSHAQGEDGPSAMIALTLPPDIAEQVVLDGGVPAEEMHITLAYLGQGLTSEQITAAEEAAMEAAAGAGPLAGTIGGVGAFSPNEDGVPVWATVDVPGLEVLRQRVVDALQAAGAPVVLNHGYTPHVTRAYLAEGDPLPDPLPPIPVEFVELEFVVGGMSTPFSLGASTEQGEDADPWEDEIEETDMDTAAETKDARVDVLRASGVPIPLSYEEIADRIRTAMRLWLYQDGTTPEDQAWIYTVATFPGVAIVSAERHAALRTWQVPYTLTPGGVVELGEPQPVDVGVSVPGGQHDAVVEQAVDHMMTLAKSLGRHEVKAGQVLSGANSRKLMAAYSAIREVLASAGITPDPAPEDEVEEMEPMPPEAPIQPDSTAPSARPTGVKAVLPPGMTTLTAQEVMEGRALLASLAAS